MSAVTNGAYLRRRLISPTESLIRASADGDAQVLKALLAQGADVNGANQTGQTALMRAALMGRGDIVTLLLEAGADLRLKDNHGLTALEWARRRGFWAVTHLLESGPPAPARAVAENTQRDEEAHLDPHKPQEFGPAATAMLKAARAYRQAEAQHERTTSVVSQPINPATTLAPKTSPPVQSATPAATTPLSSPPAHSINSTPTVETMTSPASDPVTPQIESETLVPTEVVRGAPSIAVTPPAFMRALLWVLVTITLVGSVLITYLVTNYFSKPETTTAPSVLPAAAPEPPSIKIVENVPVLAGEIAGAEASVPNPEYPANAKSAVASGRVTVLIRVNGAGGVVIAAHALNGDRQLRVAAEKAARKAKFFPQKLPKQTKVLSGTITYSFAPPQTQATATTGPPRVSSDNDLPLIGGALVGAETSVPNAEYPDKAKRKGVSGTVMVVVKVNKEGNVITARALNGDSSLRAAAVKAARRATFSPDKLSDEGKIVSGTITYRFRP